jgi:tetratricopeptide (TPR) repeat protein
MTTAAIRPAAPAQRSRWFRSAAFDLPLILAVPCFTWPLVMAGESAWGPALLNQLILLTATGHYFATFVRAYGDRELFARFRTRFLLAPAVLLVTCVGLFASGQAAPLLLVTAGWAFWHWLAQAFGFALIYDIKAGSYRPLTAWLDKALVTAGFVGAVVLNPGSTATFGKVVLDAGIPLPGASAYATVQSLVLVAIALVLAAYAVNLGWTIVRRRPWSSQKQLMHVTTIGYYWFAFAYLPNVLVAYVLYELFHDIQYYAITWLTCRQRAQRPGIEPWFARLFRPHWGAALAFVALMSAFGGVDIWGRAGLAAGSLEQRVWLGLSLTAALLHYYYDGFIWKARERALGADLGIQTGLAAAVVPRLRHGALWALFFGPLLLLFACGGGAIRGRARAEALVAVAPGDFLSRNDLGFELTRSRKLPEAIEHYRTSIAANPDFAPSRVNFGAALELQGELDAAREQYEQALRCRDRDGAHAQAHVNVGILWLLRGNHTDAARHFGDGQRLGGEHPVGRMLALAAALPADAVARRQGLYTAVLEVDPRQFDAHWQLGSLLLAQQRLPQARDHLAFVAAQAPGFVPGLVALATAQAEMGELEQARATVQQALQHGPGNADARALAARLQGR